MIKFIDEHKLKPFIYKFVGRNKWALKLLKGGLLNQNYILIVGSKKFVLKVYRPEVTVEKAKEMFGIMRFILKHGIPAVLPIDSTIIEGFTVSIFPFINAEHPPRYKNSHGRIKNMGIMLGKIHSVLGEYKTTAPIPSLEKLTRPLEPRNSLSEIKDLRKRLRTLPKTNRRELMSVLDTYEDIISTEAWGNVAFDKLPVHYIHGDYHINNLFTKDNKVIAIIDWEKSKQSYRAYEIMRSVIFNCRKSAGEFSWPLIEEYLKAYTSQIKITDIEAEYAFECGYRAVVFGFWAIRQYLAGHKHFRTNILKRKKIIQLMTKHRAEYSERIAGLLLK